MKNNPVDTEEYNQNVSNEHPLREFFLFIFISVFVVFLFYWGSIFAVEGIVDHITPEMEKKLMGFADFKKEGAALKPERFQELLDSLVESSSLRGRKFRLEIIESKEINAFALPGNVILLMKELVDKAKSENEIAMVLGHELGHFYYRHHLKGMGRRLVIAFVAFSLLGENGFSKILAGGVEFGERKYNRRQEHLCDLYGVDLLYQRYGHLNGAYDFFERLSENENELLAYFSSHPPSKNRIEKIREYALLNNYPLKGELTLPTDSSISTSDSL